MAFLAQDDKLKKEDPSLGDSGIAGSGLAPQLSSNGSIVSNAVSGSPNMGAAPGGSGGWTNIQAYLKANQGNTNSANYLNNKIGTQFNQERTNLSQSASDTLSKAKQQVAQNKIGQDQASQMIQEASSLYSIDPAKKNPKYSSIVGNLQGKLNAQYQGPTSYQYGFQAPTQEYGTNLKSDQGFQSIMNSLYDQAAGGRITDGARALQQQLDTNNSALNSARQNLLGKYSSLLSDRDYYLKDTNAGITQAQKDFKFDQNQLKDYLEGQQSTNKSAVESAVDAWNKKYSWMNTSSPDQNNEAMKSALSSIGSLVDYADSSPGVDVYSLWASDPNYWANHPNEPKLRDLNHLDYINKGTAANTSNIETANPNKRAFNTLADILGLGGGFEFSQDAPQAVTPDRDRLIGDLRQGAQNTIDQTRRDGKDFIADQFQKVLDLFNQGLNGEIKKQYEPYRAQMPKKSPGNIFYKLPDKESGKMPEKAPTKIFYKEPGQSQASTKPTSLMPKKTNNIFYKIP